MFRDFLIPLSTEPGLFTTEGVYNTVASVGSTGSVLFRFAARTASHRLYVRADSVFPTPGDPKQSPSKRPCQVSITPNNVDGSMPNNSESDNFRVYRFRSKFTAGFPGHGCDFAVFRGSSLRGLLRPGRA